MNILALMKNLLLKSILSACGAYAFYALPGVVDAQLYNASGVIAGVCATLLGFLVTAIAIIVALVDKTLISNMRKTGHYSVLMKDAFVTCACLLSTLAASCTALVIHSDFLRITCTVIAFLLILSLLCAYQSGRRFAIVVISV